MEKSVDQQMLFTFYHLAYASGYIRPETLRHRSVLVA